MTLFTRLRRLFAPKRRRNPPLPSTPPSPWPSPPIVAAPELDRVAVQEAPPSLVEAIEHQLSRLQTPIPQALRPEVDHGCPAELEADDEEEDAEGAAEPEDDLDDPLSGRGEPLQISLPTVETVAAGRREAERLALSGPQKVTLTDPAGPGSLAETLARMEADGRLASEVVEDPESGPCILYRPL